MNFNIHSLFAEKQGIALSVRRTERNADAISWRLLSFENKGANNWELLSKEEGEDWASLADYASHLPKKELNVYLHYETVICLEKRIEGDYSAGDIIERNFPGIQRDQFYWVLHEKPVRKLVLVQQSEISELLQKLNKIAIYPVAIQLAKSAAFTIAALLKSSDPVESTLVNTWRQYLSGKTSRTALEACSHFNDDYSTIGVSANYWEAFSAFASLSRNPESGLSIEALVIEQKERQAKRMLKALLPLVLVCLLGLGILARWYCTCQETTRSLMQQELYAGENSLNKLQDLRDDVKEYNRLRASFGKAEGSTVSLFFNELIEKIPGDIALDQLNYQPLSDEKLDGNTSYDTNILNGAGWSANDDAIFDWMNAIRLLSWVAELDGPNLEEGENKGETRFFFTIKIAG